MIYSCDFETSVDNKDNPKETWVYLWGSMDIDSEDFVNGRDIKSFCEWLEYRKDKDIFYFHNLKFDGSFILNHYLKMDNTYTILSCNEQNDEKVKEKVLNIIYETTAKELKEFLYRADYIDKKGFGLKDVNLIKTTINNMGIWYSIEITFIRKGKKYKKITIYDSLKLLNMSVAEIADGFLGIKDYKKLDYDYDVIRYPETELNQEDYDYIKRDCEIVARALRILKREYNVVKHTAASASMNNFKKTLLEDTKEDIGDIEKDINNIFRVYFPELNNNEINFSYKSYKGGISYVNPEHQNSIIGDGEEIIGSVFDANSLYPSVMINEKNIFPCGEGVYFQGEYEEDNEYPLYIQRLRCEFKLKKHKLPTINLKARDFEGYNKYVEIGMNTLLDSSEGQIVELVLNSVDYELFIENYNIRNIEFIDGYKYRSCSNIFINYMRYWEKVKKEAVKNKNKTMKAVAKLFLNSLYGKFGLKSMHVRWKIPYMNEEGILKFHSTIEQNEESMYMPMASFITGYARKELVRMYNILVNLGHKIYGEDYNVFCYCDTDSLHVLLKIQEILDYIEKNNLSGIIDDGSSFGKWKKEEDLYKAIYIRSKTYLEQNNNNTYKDYYFSLTPEKRKELDLKSPYSIACAGLPKKAQGNVDFNNFKESMVFKDVKLIPKQVIGGQALVEEDFEIKSNKIKKHRVKKEC